MLLEHLENLVLNSTLEHLENLDHLERLVTLEGRSLLELLKVPDLPEPLVDLDFLEYLVDL